MGEDPHPTMTSKLHEHVEQPVSLELEEREYVHI
jgi:hypothetical protein